MKRQEKLMEKAQAIIEKGDKPSIELLAEELGWTVDDVHSVVNSLEKEGRIETYVKEILGRKIRLVALKR